MLSAVPEGDQKDPANGKDMAKEVGNLLPQNVIKKGLVLLEWKYFPTPKILDP